MLKLVLSHGGLAAELLHSVEQINGAAAGFPSLCIPGEAGVAQAREAIERRLEEITEIPEVSQVSQVSEDPEPILILCALYGDTPFRAASTLVRPGRVQVIGGVNLAMLLKLACSATAGLSLEDTARVLRDRARCAIEIGKVAACPAAAAEGDPRPAPEPAKGC